MRTFTRSIVPIVLFFACLGASAQQKGSIDLGYMHNGHSKLNGVNLSYYHHLNEHWSIGVEGIRFFPAKKIKTGEETELSAWDFEFNLHYNIKLSHEWKFYPIAGIGHTSEKEIVGGVPNKDKIWSFNTGAGIGYEKGHWAPHVEYSLSWGEFNQQFYLVGISYELDWK